MERGRGSVETEMEARACTRVGAGSAPCGRFGGDRRHRRFGLPGVGEGGNVLQVAAKR